MKKFDTIKVGRVRFKVTDFRCENNSISAEELYNQELREAKEVKTVADLPAEDETEEKYCKICWSSESTNDNPLILPCACKGSCGLVHFNCVK